LRKNSKLIYLAATALEVFSNWALYTLTYSFILIKNLYWFKKYRFLRILAEFLKIYYNRESVGMLLTLILETCSTDQRHDTSRLKHTCTEENVITVDEMVGLLNHKGQKQTYHSIRQIFKETGLTKCNIVQIVHSIYGQTCILFTNMLAVYYC